MAAMSNTIFFQAGFACFGVGTGIAGRELLAPHPLIVARNAAQTIPVRAVAS